MRKLVAALTVLAGGACLLGSPGRAEPLEYVRVCDAFGAGYLYIPGTETCLNPNTGETREVVEPGDQRRGQSDLSNRVSDTESGIADVSRRLNHTDEALSTTQKELSKAQDQIDALEQSQAALEERFENAFEESMDGIAIAMALSSPDLVAGERFAVKFNLGTYNGSSAFGVAVAGVLARTDAGRVTLSGGVATTGANTGGNVGMQFSW